MTKEDILVIECHNYHFFKKNESYQLKKKKILKGSYLVLKGSYYYTSITITKISNAEDSHVVNANFFFNFKW